MSQKDLLAKINDDPMRIEQARCETFGIWRGQRLRDLEVVDAKKMATSHATTAIACLPRQAIEVPIIQAFGGNVTVV